MTSYKVSVVRCDSYDPKNARGAILKSLENINFKFKKNQKILIKPNFLCASDPKKAIITHPVLLKELCKILKEKNAKIYIGDSSCYNTDKTINAPYIRSLSKSAKLLNFDKEKTKRIKIGTKSVLLPEILFEVDLIINFAKLKTHSLTKATLCAKNMYGCVPGNLKTYFHRINPDPKQLSKFLFELNKKIVCKLNFIDGILGMEGNGPGASGDPIKSKVIIASENTFAADIIASEIMGFKYKEIETNNLSKIKKEDIQLIGNKIPIYYFKKPGSIMVPVFIFFNKLLPSSKIVFNKELCKKCHICEKGCPVKAITLKTEDNYPVCYHKKCIKCLCCIEMCPHKAVVLKDPLSVGMGRLVSNQMQKFAKKVKNMIKIKNPVQIPKNLSSP